MFASAALAAAFTSAILPGPRYVLGCGFSRCWTAWPTTATPAVRSSSWSSDRSSPVSRAPMVKARCFARPSGCAAPLRVGVARPLRFLSMHLPF